MAETMTTAASGSRATGDPKPSIAAGDFVVTKERYSINVHFVMKVTPQSFYHMRGMRETRQSSANVVFSGPEHVANKLAAQLTSSRAQKSDDERRAYERREERDTKFINAAIESLRSPVANSPSNAEAIVP